MKKQISSSVVEGATNSKASWTPEPWHWEKDSLHCYQSNLIGKNGELIGCMGWTAPGSESSLSKADARLIAAAPDLLAACQELLKMVDELLPLAPQGCGWGTLATDEARNVIAQATAEIAK